MVGCTFSLSNAAGAVCPRLRVRATSCVPRESLCPMWWRGGQRHGGMEVEMWHTLTRAGGPGVRPSPTLLRACAALAGKYLSVVTDV